MTLHPYPTAPDPRATVWCQQCERTEQVVRILVARKHNHHRLGDKEYRAAHRLPASDSFYLPAFARHIEGFAACGHRLNVITTLTNIAGIHEWMPVK